VVYGRETFGYPSKLGDVSIVIGEGGTRVAGSRLGREFFSATAVSAAPGSGDIEDAFDLLGVQVPPLSLVDMPPSRLVRQPWRISWTSDQPVDPDMTSVVMPATSAPGRIGRPDPWFELVPCRVVSGRVGRAVQQRLPGRIVRDLAGFVPLERYDGQLTGAATTSSKATFLLRRSPLR
jgi:hypothetical protein